MMPQKTESMKFINKIIVLVFALIFTQVFAQQKTKIDGVAAVVGDNIVLYSEVKAAKLQVDQENEGESKISECTVIEKIMNDKLLAHQAVIDSILIEEATVNSEVDRKIDYFKSQLGSKEKVMEFFGFDQLSDLKKELFNVEKEANLVKKMQQKIVENIDVTPEEVSNYFKSLKKENSLPEFGTEIILGQIVVTAENDNKAAAKLMTKLKNIKKDIENGSSFRMKAILHSMDPAASKPGNGEGGLYKSMTLETPFVKEFKEAAFSLEEGEISEPFKSQFGYHILKVEKIKGRERDVRHILLQMEISDAILEKTKDSLIQIRNDILTQKLSFEEAVVKYSSDKDTNKNKGILINPVSNDVHFDLARMDPALYARVSNLKIDEISEVFYDETREGKKMFKIMLMKKKIESHVANFDKDYVKIKKLALRKKRQELVSKWTKKKLGNTYIKIHNQYKKCTFEYDWLKN
ncbi:MAG: peptidylprolyl isomerase [Flavobacteriaceae bacterium]|nr:peptidylprolyl isomerase [Flavobacteriaceae bacterium]